MYLYEKQDGRLSSPSDDKIERIEVTENGVTTCVQGEDYARKGFAHAPTVRAVSVVKKAVISVLRIIESAPYLLPFLLLAKKPILREFAKYSHRVLRDYYFKPQFYLTSSKEIHRVGMGIEMKNREMLFNLVMFFVMLFEYDDAYRFRLQFALENLNKENLKKSPKKELRRICDILSEKEQNEYMKKKWQTVKRVMIFAPKSLTKVLLDVNMDKVRMDAGDLYFANRLIDFDN